MDIDTKAASNRLTDALFNGHESITFKQIKTSALPGFAKSWFHFTVESWFVPEYSLRSSLPEFDYADAAVSTALQNSDSALKDTARFDRETSRQVIEGALRHEVAYVERPVDAVTGILFQNSEVIDGAHVVDFLAQFSREPYYGASIQTYVSEHEDSRLDQDLLEQFLINAERVAYETDPVSTFGAAVEAVTDMLNIIGASTSGQLSSDIWTTFIESRNIQAMYPGISGALDAVVENLDRTMTADDLVEHLDAPHLDAPPPTSNDSSDPTLPSIPVETAPVVDLDEVPSEAEPLEPDADEVDLSTEQDTATEETDEDLEVVFPADMDSTDDETKAGKTEPFPEIPVEDDVEILDMIIDEAPEGDRLPHSDQDDPADDVVMTEAPVDPVLPAIEPDLDVDDSVTSDLSGASTFAPPEDQFGILSGIGDEEVAGTDTDDTVSDVSDQPPAGTATSPGEQDTESAEDEAPEEETELSRMEKMAIANTPTAPSEMNISIPPVEITEKLEKMFIKKLFNKRPESYQEVLGQLEDAVSWEEAFSIIEEIWQERALNLFSKESQEFTRVFYERYYPPT